MELPQTCVSPAVPTIYLDTATQDKICLLSEEGGDEGRGSQSTTSLPNLEISSDSPPVTGRSQRHVSRTEKGAKSPSSPATNSTLSKPSQLSVYCSPRVSRRSLARSPGSERKSRVRGQGSQSTEDSDSIEDLQSASHMSTCATSDYTRFTSCDRLTGGLPEPLTPEQPSGRLRRIYSNPEAQWNSSEGALRDSKSCSDLEVPGHINHAELEYRLYREGDQLLSPPALYPPAVPHQQDDQALSFDQIYDQVYQRQSGSAKDSPDRQACREVRIRQWLQEVSISVPKDERNHVTDS